ncbi:MAG: hypothetical protein WDZ75_01590 [Candidatus Paceibacterota bacterium]
MSTLTEIISDCHVDFSIPHKWSSFWNELPRTKLLCESVLTKSIEEDDVLHLVSATDLSVRQIQKRGVIEPGMGCLCSVVYCVQGFQKEQRLIDIHNFGSSVMLHKDYSQLTPIVFSLKTKNLNIKPFDYLRMGPLFLYVYTQLLVHDSTSVAGFDAYIDANMQKSSPFIENLKELCVSESLFTTASEARVFIDSFVEHIKNFKTLSYAYFEACSLALLLLSQDQRTIALSKKGELNNYLYIRTNQLFQDSKRSLRFESYGFSPTSNQLCEILESLYSEDVASISPDYFLITVANSLLLFTERFLSPEAIRGMYFYDYSSTALGQEKNLKRFVEEQASFLVAMHRKDKGIELIFNSTIPKGELGICNNLEREVGDISYGEYVQNNKRVKVLDTLSVGLGLGLPLARNDW